MRNCYRFALATLAISLGAGCAAPEDKESVGGYAAAVYGEYEQASSGKISFRVSPISRGALSALADRPVNDILAVPDFTVAFTADGVDIVAIEQLPRLDTDEWRHPIMVSGFEVTGHPIAGGAYRLLNVRQDLGGTVSEHKALEVCWSSDGYCIVMDPVVDQLDGFYKNRQTPAWTAFKRPQVDLETPNVNVDEPDTRGAQALYCRLGSNHSSTVLSRSYSEHYAAGFNALGWKLYENFLKPQRARIACNGGTTTSTCKALPSGAYSNASSCVAYWGWSCDCDNKLVGGTTGSTSKSEAVTKCVNKGSSVSITAGISGSGANVSITWSWTTGGSVYSLGGAVQDFCGMF
jgi:hypothetical protein